MNCEYQQYCHRTPEECPTPHNCSLYEEFQRIGELQATIRLDKAIKRNEHNTEKIRRRIERIR